MTARRSPSPLTFALFLCCSLAGEELARAVEPGATPAATSPAQNRELAKAKYQQGVEAYRAQRYADAVRSFLEADAISPSAALSYNIARAYEKLADDAQTLRWYRNYLRLNPGASNAAEVTTYVRALSSKLAQRGIQQVSVLSTPPGATVAIDGNPLGVTPLTVELPPGAHSALLSLRGYADQSSDFTLTSADPLDVALTLQPAGNAGAANVASAPNSAGASGSNQRFGVVPYVTLGVAGACLAAAGVFELSRRSAQNSAEHEQVQRAFEDDVNSIDNRRTAARAFLGVGSVLAVTGGALLLLNTRVTPESRAVVAGVPGGATFALERSF